MEQEITITRERDRTIVYKTCGDHKSLRRYAGESTDAACAGCRRASFIATMRARGAAVKVPTYKGDYPRDWSYFGVGTKADRWAQNVRAWA